ncbi:hypothetical protein D3C71_1425650 [compost metagenome]
MPAMIVWPDSWSVLTRNDGSSAARRLSARPIFSWSPLDFGSIAIWMTGSGNSMRSRITGFSGSQSVSPVVVSLRPARATMSPAKASSMSSREFECICSIRPTRSRLSLTVLMTDEPFSSLPE